MFQKIKKMEYQEINIDDLEIWHLQDQGSFLLVNQSGGQCT